MSQNPTSSEWVTSRGEKWSAQLLGMEATIAPVTEPLVRALQLDAPYRIAEVGCGGGGTAFEILRRAPAGSVVHGFDISPVLVERARGRARADEPAPVFEVADMSSAAPAAPYARLVSRFGVMFFEDDGAAFANLARWLEPRGRFAFAVWGPTPANPWIAGVRDVVAELVEVPKPDPEGPGPFRYADSGKLVSVLERAGFADVGVTTWRGALPIGGGLPPAEAAEFAIAAFSMFGELLSKAGEEAKREAHRSLTARWSEHQDGGVVRLDACVHIVTGRR